MLGCRKRKRARAPSPFVPGSPFNMYQAPAATSKHSLHITQSTPNFTFITRNISCSRARSPYRTEPHRRSAPTSMSPTPIHNHNEISRQLDFRMQMMLKQVLLSHSTDTYRFQLSRFSRNLFEARKWTRVTIIPDATGMRVGLRKSSTGLAFEMIFCEKLFHFVGLNFLARGGRGMGRIE